MERQDALTREAEELAAQLEAEAAPPPPEDDAGAAPAPEAAPATNAEELQGALEMLRELARPMFPSVAAVYDDETIGRVSDATAPVLDKYGITPSGLFGAWREEIRCALVVVPVLIATGRAVREDLDARRAAAAKPAADPAPEAPPAGA